MKEYIILWNSGEYEYSDEINRLNDTAIRLDVLLSKFRKCKNYQDQALLIQKLEKEFTSNETNIQGGKNK